MIHIISYCISKKEFTYDIPIAELSRLIESEDFYLWVDLEAPDTYETEILNRYFNFDELTIEDCIHNKQLPKLETFESYHFFIIQGIGSHTDDLTCQNIELDGYLGDRFLVTYHSDSIPAITEAFRNAKRKNSRLSQGSAYLTYEILDPMIDMYLPVLDYLDERIRLLNTIMHNQSFGDHSALNYMTLSSHILELRRIATKNERVFYQFSHSSLQFIDNDEARLFRDIHDHMLRVMDLSEYYQHSLHEGLNIQLSLNANRVNQVVQFLTIWATIMLPLNVMTGIYGMNFHFMPFLESPYCKPPNQ